jgi:hypothetical protein
MLGGLIGAVLGGIAGLPLVLAVSIFAMLIGIVWCIYAAVAGGNIVDHRIRLDIAKQCVGMIRQDAGEQAPFSMRVALSSKPTRLSEEAWHGRKNGKQQFFEETWLAFEGPLLDGTVVSDEIKDLARKRTFTNPRGKRKTKTRITHLVNVRFSYPKHVYGDARAAAEALHDDVKPGSSATLRSVRVTEKAVVLKAVVDSDKRILETARILSLGGYRILNLARMTAAQRENRQ